MNTFNNKRRRDSQKKIEHAFIELIQDNEVHELTVTDICTKAQINRSTFYANYLDIYDLVDKIKDKMINDFEELYHDELTEDYNSNDFSKLFQHIKDNQLFYKAYFKLNFDIDFKTTKYDTHLASKYYNNQYVEYHMDFFKGGITSIIKLWLKNNCDISPDELFNIIKDEYKNKH
ncbi:MAG: TetR/AcrR family transcriptional regulator C-terminal domain-containing protein, partial [Coprobacillus sp.]